MLTLFPWLVFHRLSMATLLDFITSAWLHA